MADKISCRGAGTQWQIPKPKASSVKKKPDIWLMAGNRITLSSHKPRARLSGTDRDWVGVTEHGRMEKSNGATWKGKLCCSLTSAHCFSLASSWVWIWQHLVREVS